MFWQTNVPTGLANVQAIAAGRWHCVALKADGTVNAWGQYHDGTYYRNMTIPAGLSNVTAIAAGEWTSMAQLNGPPQATAQATVPSFSNNMFGARTFSRHAHVYRLESIELHAPTYAPASSLKAGNGEMILLKDFSATNSRGYYQIREW